MTDIIYTFFLSLWMLSGLQSSTYPLWLKDPLDPGRLLWISSPNAAQTWVRKKKNWLFESQVYFQKNLDLDLRWSSLNQALVWSHVHPFDPKFWKAEHSAVMGYWVWNFWKKQYEVGREILVQKDQGAGLESVEGCKQAFFPKLKNPWVEVICKDVVQHSLDIQLNDLVAVDRGLQRLWFVIHIPSESEKRFFLRLNLLPDRLAFDAIAVMRFNDQTWVQVQANASSLILLSQWKDKPYLLSLSVFATKNLEKSSLIRPKIIQKFKVDGLAFFEKKNRIYVFRKEKNGKCTPQNLWKTLKLP